MKERLPEGWVLKNLSDVCTKPQYGWTSSATSSGKIRLLRTTDISNGKINWDEVPFCQKEPKELDKFLIHRNDILVSRAGSVGISYRIKNDDLSHQTVFASYLIRFRPLVPAGFIEHYLQSYRYWTFISGSQLGIAVPNVNASKLSLLPVPVPPLNEQKRIVARLDRIIPRIDELKARLDNIPTIIKRFRQSVLTAAVTSRLTEKWREDQPGAEGPWIETSLQAQSDYITSGSRGWAKYYSQAGAVFVRAQNVNTDKLILDDVAFVSLPNKTEGTRTKIQKNDILITITGANVTKTALVDDDIGEAYVNQHIALVRFKKNGSSGF